MSVCVLGSLNLDQVCAVSELPRPGMTILSAQVDDLPGGKGLNQAIASARMGAVTQMIGAVGADADGEMLRGYLDRNGVRTDAVVTDPIHRSGRATIAVSPAGDNQIIVMPGANAHLTLDPAVMADMTGFRVFLAQLETPIDTIAAFFASEAAQGGRKILNAAPAIAGGEALFGMADMLIFNQSEFATYLQLDAEPETVEELLVVRRLLTRHNQGAVVTLGARGAAAIWADRTLFVDSILTDAVDTSGAGDCFCGVIAAAVAEGIGPERALLLANAAASVAVESPGAAASIPSRDRIEARIVESGR